MICEKPLVINPWNLDALHELGVGLWLAPMIVSFLLRKSTYEIAVTTLAVILLAPVAVAILAEYPASNAGFRFADALNMLTQPAVLVSALALLCYASLDTSFCNWLPAFGKEVIGHERPDADPNAADASAQRLISVYAVAMIIGRLLASQVPHLTEYGSYFIAAASRASFRHGYRAGSASLNVRVPMAARSSISSSSFKHRRGGSVVSGKDQGGRRRCRLPWPVPCGEVCEGGRG